MSDQMSDEMGAPGYPPGDRTTEEQTQAERGDQDAPGQETIRRRAYEISQGADAGTPEENWSRAEREIASEERGS